MFSITLKNPLLKWKKQVNLLDTETEEILDRLEQLITRRVSDRREGARP